MQFLMLQKIKYQQYLFCASSWQQPQRFSDECFTRMHCIHGKAKQSVLLNQKLNMSLLIAKDRCDPADILQCAVAELAQPSDESIGRNLSLAVSHHSSFRKREREKKKLFTSPSFLHLSRFLRFLAAVLFVPHPLL